MNSLFTRNGHRTGAAGSTTQESTCVGDRYPFGNQQPLSAADSLAVQSAKRGRWLSGLLGCWLGAQVGMVATANAADALVEEGATVQKLAGDMRFTEGPVWLPDQKLLVFSDIPASKWMQWSSEKGLSVYRESQQANGNVLDREGRIVACQHAGRNVVRLEQDGSITVLTDRYAGKRYNSPNDVAVKSDGSLWFTDPPWGLTGEPEIPGHWVFRCNPEDGAVEVVIRDLAMPNGINFSPDEKQLYVADTGGHRRHPDPAFHNIAAGIHCYEISEDVKLGKKLFQIPRGSDGMAVDEKGNLYTTDDKIYIYDADGKQIGVIEVPEQPANVCFGGDDNRTLFITARTSLYSIRLTHAGARIPGTR